MARARNIKPSFFTNDSLADNDPLGRLLFIGLWTLADHKGNLEWRPKRVKAQLLPYDNCDVEKLAINLDKSGFVRFYSVGGQAYLNIPTFTDHQNPHKNEREKGTDIPEYSIQHRQAVDIKGLAINRDKSGVEQESSHSDRADSLFLNPDSLNLNPDSPLPDSGESRPKDAANQVIDYLNDKLKSRYKHTDRNRGFVNARIREGSTLEELMAVIDFKCSEWVGTDQAQYLRPETLFGNKFEGYLLAASTAKHGKQSAHTDFDKREYTEHIPDWAQEAIDEAEGKA